MAKRYRYAFTKKREAQKGKLSAVLAVVSLVLFVTAVLLAFFLQGQYLSLIHIFIMLWMQ